METRTNCCCCAYLSSCHRTASDANLLDDPHTFQSNDYFVIGGIRTCLGVSSYPMFLLISSNSRPLHLLLVRSHQAEIIIVKRLIQECNNVTRVRVEPRPFDQDRSKKQGLYPVGHAADQLLNLFTEHLVQRSKLTLQFFLKSTEHSNRATQQSTDKTHLNIPRYRTTKLQRWIKYFNSGLNIEPFDDVRTFFLWRARVLKVHNGHH